MRTWLARIGMAAGLLCCVAWADGTVSGEGRFERIKGRPGDYVGLYEWDLYLSADGGTHIGQTRRLGAGLGGGKYSITAPAGPYTIYVTQPIFFARAKVVRNVQILDGQTITVNPELNLDYSCYEMGDGNWTEFNSPWYQTFIATGTSINRIQFRLAGWDCSSIAVSVHEDNGGYITTWPQVGPTKTTGVGYGDAWTGYRSGDIPTTPGRRYCVKLTGIGGTGGFAIRCRTEDGNGYAQGQAYDAWGNPRDIDLHITVFSDNDGTVIPYADTTLGNVEDYAGSAYKWGQTFRATGAALAAADCFIAGGGTWDIDVRFLIRRGGAYGPQVGPVKVAQAAYQAAHCGIVGVSYARGEVPLTPGDTYYIEMTTPDGTPFGAYKFHSQADNGYPYGDAYKDGVLQADTDLEMTIMEYKQWWSDHVVNPSFEDYGGSLEGWTVSVARGDGPDDPPLANGNPYGLSAPDGAHFAGKIASDTWEWIDFTLGQILEVPDWDPAAEAVGWNLSAYVQLHCSQSGFPWPHVVHQVWELGWNDDGSLPSDVDACDNYQVIADIDGDFTGNDRYHFHPLELSGSITGVQGLRYVALRVRCYNDAQRQLCMCNLDDVDLQLTTAVGAQTPPGFYKPGWNLTSVPVEPFDAEASAVFADLVDLGNDLTNNLFAYEPGSGYSIYPGGFSQILLGKGYWLYLTVAPADAVVSVAGTPAAGDVAVALAEGWNMIGHPHDGEVLWSACRVSDGATEKTLADAVASGWIDPTAYYYQGGSYKLVRADGSGDDDRLRPWYGYWVLANRSGLTLLVPQP